jgi:hypothetical protein
VAIGQSPEVEKLMTLEKGEMRFPSGKLGRRIMRPLFAGVLIESNLDFPFGLILLGKVGAKLGGAGFADRDGLAGIALYDPQGAWKHKIL